MLSTGCATNRDAIKLCTSRDILESIEIACRNDMAVRDDHEVIAKTCCLSDHSERASCQLENESSREIRELQYQSGCHWS